MDLFFFVSMLLGFQIVYWFIGYRSSKKLEGKADYFLAKKSIGFFPLMMTFLATTVGGGLFLGSADEAYTHGWAALAYPLGNALGLLFLGLGIGKKLASFNVSTVAQIFEDVYKSPQLKKTASLLSIIALFMILVAQIVASSKFLVSLGLDSTLFFALFWASVVLYTVQGGLRSVVSTDMMQAAVFSLIFLFAFAAVFFSKATLHQLPTFEWAQFVKLKSHVTGWLLMPMLWMFIGQDMGQRCFAGRRTTTVSKATFVAGIITMTVCMVPIFFGMLAKASHIAPLKGGSVLMAIMQQVTNPWISALVGCAVLAAIISTATSLLNAISSNLSTDFKQIHEVKSIKWLTAGIALAAFLFAFFFDNIVSVLIQSYDLYVSCLFVPLFIAFFKKEGSSLSALFSVLFGAASFFLFKFITISIPHEIASLLFSLGGFFIGEIFATLSTKQKALP